MVYVKNVYFKWFGGVYFFFNLDLNLFVFCILFLLLYVVYRLKGVFYKGM